MTLTSLRWRQFRISNINCGTWTESERSYFLNWSRDISGYRKISIN